MEIRVTGVLLCGGRSSRMGCNKALLPFKGRKLLEHMVDVLSQVEHPRALEEVLLSGLIDGYSSVPDLIEGKGPLGGVYSLLRAVLEREGDVLGDLLSNQSQRDRSVRGFIGRLSKVVRVAVDHEEFFVNANTPEEWKQCSDGEK